MSEPALPVADLLRHPLFDRTDLDRYRHLIPYVVVREAPRGTLLNSPDAPSSLFHLVLRGQLRTSALGRGRRTLVFEFIDAGGFDGILPVTGHGGHRTEVIEDALLTSMDLRTLQRLTLTDPRIVVNLLGLIADRLKRREEHLETIALYEPPARLARQLLALAHGFGTPDGEWTVLQRHLTHQLIADMLGLRRETVTLHLRQLTELGAVRFSGGQYRLHREALQRLAAPYGPTSALEDAPADGAGMGPAGRAPRRARARRLAL